VHHGVERGVFLEDGCRCAPREQLKVGWLIRVKWLPGENQALEENLASLGGKERRRRAGSRQ
jgi:hypothetical protein